MAVNDGDNRDTCGLHTIDQAIAVDEPFADRFIAKLWHDASPKRQIDQSASGFKEPRNDSLGVPRRVALDVLGNLLDIF